MNTVDAVDAVDAMDEEKKERKAPLVLIIFCLLALLVGGLWAAHFIGLINLAPLVKDVPYLNQWIEDPFADEAPIPTPSPPPPSPTVNPLETENRELRLKIEELQQDLLDQTTVYEREKTEALRENTALKAQVEELETYRSNTEAQAADADKTAAYLAGMKPDAIVKVMDNLDDNMVVQIFELLSESQVSKVLALMDPERAAVITRMLLE
jgi:flagellar motility protein MotE (MotC chaperone)